MVLKTLATFGGVPLAGTEPVTWQFVTGAQPYVTTVAVHEDHWARIQGMRGSPQTLVISDSDTKISVKSVYVLEEQPSSTPYEHRFNIGDKRYWWRYVGVARDYNISKAVGAKIFLRKQQSIKTPVQNNISADQHDYRQYSLKNGKDRWTAQDAVKDLLELIDSELEKDPGHKGSESAYKIKSFPIKEGGQFSLQNVMLTDSADVAMDRLLSFIPGAEIYVDEDGVTIVFDGADMDASDKHYEKTLEGKTTYGGDFARQIDRAHIRPAEIHVKFEREVECVFKTEDDYSKGTKASIYNDKNDSWAENVIPTTDPVTEVNWDDPIGGTIVTDVPAGTWLPAWKWLEVHDELKGEDSSPWTFETVKDAWMKKTLANLWGAHPKTDLSTRGHVQARVDSFIKHFRQTYRINRRFMERIRDISAVRTAIINPMTGDQAPPPVWGEMTILPTAKGMVMSQRFNPDKNHKYNMISTLPKASSRPFTEENDEDCCYNPSLPLNVRMVDADRGIFRVEHDRSPYGTDSSWVPGFLEYAKSPNQPQSATRDLSRQMVEPVHSALAPASDIMVKEVLREKFEMWFLLTIIPGAPNNKSRYHTVVVKPSDVDETYRATFRIQDGKGPAMEVFVDPGEYRARFAWQTDEVAFKTIQLLLGLNSEDPNKAGLKDDPKTKDQDESKMLGFFLTNESDEKQKKLRHLKAHAIAMAAEVWSNYADGLAGVVSTGIPTRKADWLVGNMNSATIEVAGYPDAEVSVAHEFPGLQDPVSRMALMPESLRRMVLGILPNRKAGKA